MKGGLVIVACALALVFGCSRSQPEREALEAYDFEPVLVSRCYLAMLEKPDAQNALLIGEAATQQREVFEKVHVMTAPSPSGLYDLVVFGCDEITRESLGRAMEKLTDDGVIAWLMDVRKVTVGDLRRRLAAFACQDVRIWATDESQWLVTGRKASAKVRLDDMLELLTRDGSFETLAKARCGTVPEFYANFIGKAEDVTQAFEHLDAAAEVLPEYFVTRDIPDIDWIDVSDVDEDIGRQVLGDVRTLQSVRRHVIEGDMLARQTKDRKSEEAATEKWASAARRNPNDLFILARLDRLDRNARGFLEVQKILMAMKCYETMVLIRPDDATAVNNFGVCLRRIGKADLAKQVLERAKMLAERQDKDAAGDAK